MSKQSKMKSVVILAILLPLALAQCNLPVDLKEEIASYAPVVQQIIEATTKGDFQNFTFNQLANLVDKFGSRMAGSQSLEDAIDYMLEISNAQGLDNVHGEEVEIRHWIRGAESAELVEPKHEKLTILGLGSTIATPPEGILAEVLVVKSFDELTLRANDAKEKIVVFNEEFVTYGVTAQYRGHGAARAAEVGAVATLVRSATPFSLNNPHTGSQSYEEDIPKIPTASITIEHARMLQRLQDKGEKLKILLKIDSQTLPNVKSRNTIAELQGTINPEKVVVVSGHLDSWDVGEGAMDDGGGVFISWSSLVVLHSLGLRPRRTIRAIFWTSEETGMFGALNYNETHFDELHNHIFLMESDIGTFNPKGIEYTAGPIGGCILEEIMKLLAPINATQAVASPGGVGSDIDLWTSEGMSGASLMTENDKYFWYHHSPADTMDVEDPVALDKNTALWASVAYIIADLADDFPRGT